MAIACRPIRTRKTGSTGTHISPDEDQHVSSKNREVRKQLQASHPMKTGFEGHRLQDFGQVPPEEPVRTIMNLCPSCFKREILEG